MTGDSAPVLGELTPDQKEIARAAGDLGALFPPDYWAAKDLAGQFPWEFYHHLAEGGWIGMAIPEEYGGGGLGIMEVALFLEKIAESGAGMNGCSAIHLSIFGMNILTRHGSDALRREILPAIVDGSLHVCFAVTEPDAGTDTTRISVTATRSGDHYYLNGKKIWITKAGEASKAIVLARTSPRRESAKTAGLSLFLADLDPARVSIAPIPKMGRNAVASNELFFDNLPVPASARIGAEGDGFTCLLDGLNPERILLAHEAVGIGMAAMHVATRYAREREVFGRPIGSNQGVAFPLAEAMARLDAARLVARRAAQLFDRQMPCAREANTAKFLCSDAGFAAADAAVQTLGGMGYAREFHVERYFREARLLRLAPVSQEIALSFLAHHVLGLPRSF